MPEFWEFPTVSMGIGPMNAIYQAQSNRYLHNRGIKDTSDQHVWAFLGDGEMDEPESRGLLQLAANDKLDNLTFVINCNLQRLDGPVRGNGKIVQELEAFFRGAGWNVIKVLWGREWDDLLAKDTDGDAGADHERAPSTATTRPTRASPAATCASTSSARPRRPRRWSQDLTDDQIWNLKRGGHDYRKVYAAYQAATEFERQADGHPRQDGQGLRPGHELRGPQRDPPDEEADRWRPEDRSATCCTSRSPTPQLEEDPYRPPVLPPRAWTPRRSSTCWSAAASSAASCPSAGPSTPRSRLPDDKAYEVANAGSGKQMAATTMAFVRLLKDLMRDKDFGQRIVPIIPDEARTFGMDSFFPTAKIYNPNGPALHRRSTASCSWPTRSPSHGQILHAGINEAGSVAAFTAAGTSYATHGEPMIPVYVFYSMFGFQRTGDAMWAADGPDGPRLHHRRHRRPHHAHRRGPAARRRPLPDARRDQPGRRQPTTRPTATRSATSSATGSSRCTARTPTDPQRHVLPDGLQRADAAAGRAGGRSTSRASSGASTC